MLLLYHNPLHFASPFKIEKEFVKSYGGNVDNTLQFAKTNRCNLLKPIIAIY